MTFVLVALFIGLALGLRFSVIALVPLMVVALMLVWTGSAARADASWPTLSATLSTLAAIQLGYVMGVVSWAVAAAVIVAGRRFDSNNTLGISEPTR
jgi:hypothetical protein